MGREGISHCLVEVMRSQLLLLEALEGVEGAIAVQCVKLADLERKDGKVFYQGRWWVPDEPVPSDRKGKKKMVLAVKNGEVALLHFGDSSMSDFTKHEDKDRRKRFYDRFGSTKSANGELALKDKHSPLYWSAKVLW